MSKCNSNAQPPPQVPTLEFDLELIGPADVVSAIDRAVCYLGNAWKGVDVALESRGKNRNSTNERAVWVLPLRLSESLGGKQGPGAVAHVRASVSFPLQLREQSSLDLVPVDHTHLPRFLKIFFFARWDGLSQFQFSARVDLVDQYNKASRGGEVLELALWNPNMKKKEVGEFALRLRPGDVCDPEEVLPDLRFMPADSEPDARDWESVTDAVKLIYNELLPYCYGWATAFRNVKNFTRVPYAAFLYTDSSVLFGKTCPYPVETVVYCVAGALAHSRMGWKRACELADGLVEDVDLVMGVLRNTLCGFAMCAKEGRYVADRLGSNAEVDDQCFQGSFADSDGTCVFSEDDCEGRCHQGAVLMRNGLEAMYLNYSIKSALQVLQQHRAGALLLDLSPAQLEVLVKVARWLGSLLVHGVVKVDITVGEATFKQAALDSVLEAVCGAGELAGAKQVRSDGVGLDGHCYAVIRYCPEGAERCKDLVSTNLSGVFWPFKAPYLGPKRRVMVLEGTAPVQSATDGLHMWASELCKAVLARNETDIGLPALYLPDSCIDLAYVRSYTFGDKMVLSRHKDGFMYGGPVTALGGGSDTVVAIPPHDFLALTMLQDAGAGVALAPHGDPANTVERTKDNVVPAKSGKEEVARAISVLKQYRAKLAFAGDTMLRPPPRPEAHHLRTMSTKWAPLLGSYVFRGSPAPAGLFVRPRYEGQQCVKSPPPLALGGDSMHITFESHAWMQSVVTEAYFE